MKNFINILLVFIFLSSCKQTTKTNSETDYSTKSLNVTSIINDTLTRVNFNSEKLEKQIRKNKNYKISSITTPNKHIKNSYDTITTLQTIKDSIVLHKTTTKTFLKSFITTSRQINLAKYIQIGDSKAKLISLTNNENINSQLKISNFENTIRLIVDIKADTINKLTYCTYLD